jgi:DNA helicase-2/ATP-dependent DNA helicase PcrA
VTVLRENSGPAEYLDFDQDFGDVDELQRLIQSHVDKAHLDLSAALKRFQPNADEYQQAVIDADYHTIRLVAPAGAGKTQTVVNRVLRRVASGIDPKRFLVLTFDGSAAQALRSKLAEQLAYHDQEMDLSIATLNSFGYRLLAEHIPSERKAIAVGRAQTSLVREIRRELKSREPGRYAALPEARDRYYIEIFGYLKNQMIDPRAPNPQEFAKVLVANAAAAPLFPTPSDRNAVKQSLETVLWLFKAYEALLQSRNQMDFDDQKLRAYESLVADPLLLRAIQNRYTEVIVDEFQDINKLDFEFIKLIAQGAVLVVVGDDDQAIYGFRGCSPEYIINFEKHLGREHLSHNFRSTTAARRTSSRPPIV